MGIHSVLSSVTNFTLATGQSLCRVVQIPENDCLGSWFYVGVVATPFLINQGIKYYYQVQVDREKKKTELRLRVLEALGLALTNAVELGDTPEVKKLLTQGKELEYFDDRHKQQNRLLMLKAAKKGYLEILNSLIGVGIKVNDLSFFEDESQNTTPLIEVARFGQVKGAKILLDAGAKVNQIINKKNPHGARDFWKTVNETPLRASLQVRGKKREKIVRILLRQEADVNILQRDFEEEPLLVRLTLANAKNTIGIFLEEGKNFHPQDIKRALRFAEDESIRQMLQDYVTKNKLESALEKADSSRRRWNEASQLIQEEFIGKPVEGVSDRISDPSEFQEKMGLKPLLPLEVQLFKGAYIGDRNEVEQALNQGASIDKINQDHSTPLIEAAKKGHYNLVEFLLKRGAPIDAFNRFQETALLMAILGGYPQVVKLLLERGANFKIKNLEGKTALELAIEKGDEVSISCLRAAGAVPEEKMEAKAKPPKLVSYLERGLIRTVEYALDINAWGSQIDNWNYYENTLEFQEDYQDRLQAFQLAAEKGIIAIIKPLLEQGIKFSRSYIREAKAKAEQAGHSAVVSFLLPYLDNPLMEALEKGEVEYVKSILAQEKELSDLWGTIGGHPPEEEERARKFCQALEIAARMGFGDIVHLVLEKGLIKSKRKYYVEKAMRLVIVCGHLKLAEMLYPYNPNPKSVGLDRNPVKLALEHGHDDIAQFFLRHGGEQ